MQGQIDERTDLSELGTRLERLVVMDLEKVSFINSVGVREWIRMLRSLEDRGVQVRMKRCSEAMIHQINMIVEAMGCAEVESSFAPYLCEDCGYEGSMCLEVAANASQFRNMDAPQVPCPECNGTMEFDEIPARYFLFLGEKLSQE
jgi:anti-anti-sigma regulatory factor